MVWINEIPWHEMDVDGELTLRHPAPLGASPGTRTAADDLPVAAHAGRHDRQRLPRLPAGHPQHRLRDHRRGRHRPHRRRERHRLAALPQADPRFRRPGKDPHAGGHPQRSRPPSTAYAAMCELYGDILPVKKVGQTHIWFTPWDYLIRWWGIEEAMLDMYERPDLVHAAVERMVDAWMVELDQFVAQNLLSLDCEQHADRLRRLRVHVGLARRGLRSAVRQAAQHVGLLQRADLLGGLAQVPLGVRPGARSPLAEPLGLELLRLLRAAGRQGRSARSGSPGCGRSPSRRGARPSGRSRRSGRTGS